jgi:hypothetical protein
MEPRVGNKYRLGRKIGSGSFGEIYLGEFSFLKIYIRSECISFLSGHSGLDIGILLCAQGAPLITTTLCDFYEGLSCRNDEGYNFFFFGFFFFKLLYNIENMWIWIIFFPQGLMYRPMKK